MNFKVKYYFSIYNFKRIFFLIFICFFSHLVKLNTIHAQEDTIRFQSLPEIFVSKDYFKKYKTTLRRLRKVYPLALYSAKKLHEIDSQLVLIESRRKKKKLTKSFNIDLREDFHYVILDLYTSEGVLLMKLIHRETGLTVSEIIEKYRGNFRSEINETLGKIWDQDLDAKYDPKGEDWMIEKVIQDIKNEIVPFEFEPKLITKEEHKIKQKQYRIDVKEARKAKKVKSEELKVKNNR
ncbi:MAG: DUF4294 domain-containing protein [Bacteroidota bacterium]